MKILYLISESNYHHPGIRKRVIQTHSFLSRKHLVDLRVLKLEIFNKTFGWYSPFQRDIGDFDLCLNRGIIYGPGWTKNCNITPIITERHVASRPESQKDIIRLNFEKLCQSPGDFSSGLLYPTEELRRLDSFRKPYQVIGNCFVGMPMTEFRKPVRNRVGMSIGSLAPWNGIARFLEMSRKLTEFEFTVALPDALYSQFLAKHGVYLGKQIRIIKTLGHDDYMNELSTWYAAVGPLSLSEKGLREAAPLKIRDAVQLGIPIFINYVDTNLSNLNDEAIMNTTPDFNDAFIANFSNWVNNLDGIGIKERNIELVSPEVIESRRLSFLNQFVS